MLLRASYISLEYNLLIIKCDHILKSACLKLSSVIYIYVECHKYLGGKITYTPSMFTLMFFFPF